MRTIVPTVMCGGSGTRLWPSSRAEFPKQFLRLQGELSLLQNTLKRHAEAQAADPWLLVGAQMVTIALDQAAEIGQAIGRVVVEPAARSTGPALAAAALLAAETDPDTVMLAIAADHVMRGPEAFHDAVMRALPAVEAGHIATFGIAPSAPDTGYGYIQSGPVVSPGVHVAQRFVEKPQREEAVRMLAEGSYHWNAGLFLFKAGVLLEALARHAPDILAAATAAVEHGTRSGLSVALDPAAFRAAPDLSIDYAVMERSDRIVVVPCDPGWSDVGNWASLWEVSEKSASGNVVAGSPILLDTRNCLVRADSARVISVIGADDLVIIDTPDALLVAGRDASPRVKEVVGGLKAAGKAEAVRPAERPWSWGVEQVLCRGPAFSMRRCVLHPGAAMTLEVGEGERVEIVVATGETAVAAGGLVRRLRSGDSIDAGPGVVDVTADAAAEILVMTRPGPRRGRDGVSDHREREVDLVATA